MNEARPNVVPTPHPGPTIHPHPSPIHGGNANPSNQPTRIVPPSPTGHGPMQHGPTQHAPAVPHSPAPTKSPLVPEEPVELISEDRMPDEPMKSKIHGITGMSGLSAAHSAHDYKRNTHSNKTGAVRMRTFHCRLSEQGVEYLDQAVNSWLDQHPEIEVKFTSSVIGLWDGKLKEPTLIMNVWY